MPVSLELNSRLQQALGEGAAEELVTLLRESDNRFDALRADVAELRHEMRSGFDTLEARIDARIARSTADLLKWSFVFWVGAVTAIAALAGVLRN